MTPDAWSKREQTLNRFESVWDSNDDPDLKGFVDELNTHERDPMLLVELSIIDLEHRLRKGEAACSEDYFAMFRQEYHAPDVQRQMICGEIAVRTYTGKPVTHDELRRRFPKLTEDVEKLIAESSNLNNPTQSSAKAPVLLREKQSLGPYRIGEVIGSGSFSVVYSATDDRSGQRVAVKLLHPRIAAHRGHRERMLREARVSASIDHPNIVSVLDVGDYQGNDYVVSRLIEGPTLEDRLRTRDFTYSRAAEIVMSLALGMHAAHEQGIVHRDLKPANILMQGDSVLITDFGLAHLSDATQNLTHEGDLVGTPSYMAPEQAAGRGWLADPRADVYSLGVILFRITTGRLPFEGTTSEVLSQVLHREPPSPRKFAADVPGDLEVIILKCLEKEPADRYQGADRLADDLKKQLAGQSIAARRPGQFSRIMKWSRRRPALAGGFLSILVLSAFLIGSLLQLGRVGNERDRAVSAESKAIESEQQTQILLASAAADAGILAMQRGHLSQAIEHFDQSLAQGVADDLPLRLRRLDALLALRRVGEARTEFRLIAEHADRKRFEGEVTLWQAELQLEPDAEGRNAIELLERALPNLTGAESAYCAGMLAENSLKALEHFRRATSADPFHRRARRMLITTLLSLARTEETLMEIAQTRNLFPEDAAIPVLESLAVARQGHFDQAEPIVTAAADSETEKETWLSFCAAVSSIEFDMGEDESTVNLRSLSEFASRVVDDFRPLMLKRGLRMPPRIAAAFHGVPELLAKKPTLQLPNSVSQFLTGRDPEIEEIQSALEAIVAAHPEMGLMTLLGYIHLMKEELDASRDRLEEALRHRSWVPNIEQGARFNLCTVTIIRALVDQHEPERNLRVLVQATDGLDEDYVKTSGSYRAIVIGLFSAQEFDKAERFVKAWMQCDDCDVANCLWHKALIEEHRGNWLTVVALTDRLLSDNGEFDSPSGAHRQHIIDMRDQAKVEITRVVSANNDAQRANGASDDEAAADSEPPDRP